MEDTGEAGDLSPFGTRLISRIWTRRSAHGLVHVLDLRGKEWAHICPSASGYITIRDPQDPEWPEKGRTTADEETAKDWVTSHYVPWLERKVKIVVSGPQAGISVKDACEKYLAALEEEYGDEHNTTGNRTSACNVHIIPRFGSLPLDALTKAQVRQFLSELKVEKSRRGKTSLVPAAENTKKNIRAALMAVWEHAYPDVAPPFGGIKLREYRANLKRRKAAEQGHIGTEGDRIAYTYEEVTHVLATAMLYDREILGRPNLAVSFIPNTPEAIALMLGTTARVEESTYIRWKHVFWREKAIFIPGTKTYNAPRWVPLQRTLEVWLQRLMDQQGGHPSPDSFVLQTRWNQPFKRASRKTYGTRIGRVELRAGLKQVQKATHILRATHISWAKDHLSLADLKEYAGHGAARGGATDDYVDRRPPFMPTDHREYLRLPTPAEIESLAAQLGRDTLHRSSR